MRVECISLQRHRQKLGGRGLSAFILPLLFAPAFYRVHWARWWAQSMQTQVEARFQKFVILVYYCKVEQMYIQKLQHVNLTQNVGVLSHKNKYAQVKRSLGTHQWHTVINGNIDNKGSGVPPTVQVCMQSAVHC